MKTELAIVWGIVCILCAVIELTTGTFFLLCVSVGALGALVMALCGLSFDVQLLVLSVLSALMIMLVRPLILRLLKKSKARPSGTGALVGRRATVSEPIPAGGCGRVQLDGDDWKARALTDADLPAGASVEVVGHESVILTVRPTGADAGPTSTPTNPQNPTSC